MVIFNRALFLRALSRFEGTAPHVIQTLYVAPMIIASLIDLFCIQTHGRRPSNTPALPLERDRLLDLLCGHVWPTLLKHFHVCIRNHFRHITCRRPSYSAPSCQRVDHHRVILDWNREEAIFSSAPVRPPDIGSEAFLHFSSLWLSGISATYIMTHCIYSKFEARNLHLLALFRKKVVENLSAGVFSEESYGNSVTHN